MIAEESRTSIAHYANAWRLFARRSKAGECREEKGVLLAWARVQTPFLNVALLSEPVRDAADLDERARRVVEYAATQQLHYMFPIATDLIPAPLRPKLDEILAKHGLKLGMVVSGMLAGALEPPLRALPTDVEFRNFSDMQSRYDNVALNLQCYGMPLEWGPEVVDTNVICTPDQFGCTGYVDGKPVTSAMAMPLDGWLYVALVATDEAYRRKGYAEAAMRYCLAAAEQATGIRRTSLHATEAGYNLYRQMGYRDVSKFLVYAPE